MRAESVEKVRRICACSALYVFVRTFEYAYPLTDGVQRSCLRRVCC